MDLPDLWWLQDKVRLARELRVVDALREEGWVRADQWSADGLDLVASITITARNVDYSLRLIYPQHYPNVPAWIMPTDGKTRLSDHQFGAGGALCLEYGPDNWTPDLTGEDVLRSTFKLLSTENPQGDGIKGTVESGHVTAPFQLGFEAYSVFLDVTLLDQLKVGPVFGLQATRWMGPEAYPVVLFNPASTSVRPPIHGQHSDFYDLPVFQTAAPAPDKADTRTALTGSFGSDVMTREAIGREERALLIFGVGVAPIAFQVFPDNGCYKRLWSPISVQSGVRSGGSSSRSAALVAIVGAGSIGSKLAETLIRSGVRKCLLVDGDIFLPENLERNALDWRDVGARKVAAVRARLLRIAPEAQIDVEAQKLNWQGSSRYLAAIAASIGDCDLVVDATGDTGASLMVGAIAAAGCKPFISVEVFEGGIGALVAACVPGTTPPYSIARARFLNWCAEQGTEFRTERIGGYAGLDDDGSPIVADDAAVSIAAGYAARVALDIIDGAPPPRSRAWQLIGLRDRWVFETLGPLVHVDVGAPLAPPPPADAATEAFVVARIKEILDAPAAAS